MKPRLDKYSQGTPGGLTVVNENKSMLKNVNKLEIECATKIADYEFVGELALTKDEYMNITRLFFAINASSSKAILIFCTASLTKQYSSYWLSIVHILKFGGNLT